jgi:ComF family protein
LDILIPVPLHNKKIKTREFNQTAILAKELSKSWKIKLELEVLIKIKDTADQASLDVNQRKNNVKNAYYLKKEVKDLNIGLIDDVVTTGSTLLECAKVLKRGGAKSIHAFTLARAL